MNDTTPPPYRRPSPTATGSPDAGQGGTSSYREPHSHRRRLYRIAGALILAGAAAVLYLFRPEDLPIPRCPFLSLTGYQCPGCGSLRGTHALLHGDWRSAIDLNLMLIPAILAILWLTVLGGLRSRVAWAERLYRHSTSAVACRSLVVVIILWWLLRNLW